MVDRIDRDRSPHQIQVHTQQHPYSAGAGGHQYGAGGKNAFFQQEEGPSATKTLIVISLLPVGGLLLALAGLTLVGTIIGLAVTTPLFIIFSPILVPAAITVGLAVTAFLASGAFGLTGLSSLYWVLDYFRQTSKSVPEQLDYAKMRMLDATAYAGQKTKDVGQEVQNKAQDAKRSWGESLGLKRKKGIEGGKEWPGNNVV